MIDFPSLIVDIEKCKTLRDKQLLLQEYFEVAPSADKIVALALLSGQTPKRIQSVSQLKDLALKASSLPDWILEESIKVSADISEAIANIIDLPENETPISISHWHNLIKNVSTKIDVEIEHAVLESWFVQTPVQRFVFNKLISGTFKSPVSKRIVIKSISSVTNINVETLSLRLSVDWSAEASTWNELIYAENPGETYSNPYPFLFPELINDFSNVDLNEFSAEWHYNGLRAQLIKRNNELFIWSKKSELITELFPELIEIAETIPNGTVIDGILNVFKNEQIRPKAQIISRIRKKIISNKTLTEFPVVFIASDILELFGKDIRTTQAYERRELLTELLKKIDSDRIILSQNFNVESHNYLNELLLKARFNSASGLILKRKKSEYSNQSAFENQLRIKTNRLTIKAVLIYAAQSDNPSAFVFSNFTFAVWHNADLMPIVKAEEGLSNHELSELNTFVKGNIVERFGPVRSVRAKHVFEISFDDILLSSRHKSGLNLLNPKISRWLTEETVENASTLNALRSLIAKF